MDTQTTLAPDTNDQPPKLNGRRAYNAMMLEREVLVRPANTHPDGNRAERRERLRDKVADWTYRLAKAGWQPRQITLCVSRLQLYRAKNVSIDRDAAVFLTPDGRRHRWLRVPPAKPAKAEE